MFKQKTNFEYLLINSLRNCLKGEDVQLEDVDGTMMVE